MDALSGFASGVAVVSLSIQLIDSIGKIKSFAHKVKDAPKELERLVELLGCLEAMLEDVHNLMGRQLSLKAHHFPMPSSTISRCLERCKKTLRSLQTVVEECAVPMPQGSKGVTGLKNRFKMGRKAEEIKSLETSIEREISFLHTTLGANSSAILMHVFPVILGNQKAAGSFHQWSVAVQNSLHVTAVTPSCQSHATSLGHLSTYVTMEVTPIKSPLEMIGIRQYKITRRLQFRSGSAATGSRKEVVSEEHDFFLAWRLVGYGLTWNLQRSYGSIMPSLRVFPIVRQLGPEVVSLMRDGGDIGYFQKLLSDGVIHPFSRRPDGFSLLHLAAKYHRIDICRLLRHLGVKAELSIDSQSPLSVAIVSNADWRESSLVDTWRHFLNEENVIDSFKDECLLWYRGWDYSNSVARWICQESTRMLGAEDSVGIHRYIIRALWSQISEDHKWVYTPAVEFPELSLAPEVWDRVWDEELQLIPTIFERYYSSDGSFVLGGALVRWLSKSGIDVEGCISQELDRFPGHILPGIIVPDRKMIFKACKERGWVLGFEWAFDRDQPGYLLISEYQGLAVESAWGFDMWPFDKPKIGPWEPGYTHAKTRRNERFSRRMATKARKERARTGQKMSRSRMPGSWMW